MILAFAGKISGCFIEDVTGDKKAQKKDKLNSSLAQTSSAPQGVGDCLPGNS